MQDIEMILKKLQGELTDKEEQAFQQWLEESKDNERLFRHFKSLQKDGKAFRAYQSMDVDKAWEQVRLKAASSQETKVRSLRIRRLMRIAAAIAILLVSGFLVYDNVIQQERTDPQLSWEQFGQPGASKAFLNTLNQKDEILLGMREEEKPDPGVPADNTGKLRYDLLHASFPIEEKEHSLRTPKGGEYQLVLSDGTKVWMNAESKLKYPPRFEGGQRLVHLEGEAYFEVARDAERPFIVRTEKMDIEVLGTAFNVKAYEKEEFSAALVEGKIRITDLEGRVTPLDPGLQYTVLEQTEGFKVEQVNAEKISAWKDGEFYFEHMELEQILKRVSNWYDIEYEFLDEKSKNIKFTGTVYRQKPLKLFLDALAISHPIELSLKGEKLIIKNE